MKNQYSGIVVNGEFQISNHEATDCPTFKLTKIPMQAAETPEGSQIDLSDYEGQNITVLGNESGGCWIYSAEVINSKKQNWKD